jgi:hypothetical protein
MQIQRDYLSEAGAIARGESILLAERRHLEALNAVIDQIAALLDGHEWTPDTIDQIAAIVRSTGRTIGEPSDEEIALAMEAHRANDPHCTCNDCIEWASREAIEGGRDEDR